VIVVSQKQSTSDVSENEDSPQDVAWLKALEVATDEVYIQTPDMCTKTMAQAIVNTVKRGVNVHIVTSYRQQDFNEFVSPGSKGSNYQTGVWIKSQLEDSEYADRFKACWYIGTRVKEVKPNPKEWSHVKAMVVDKQFAMVGSGNQDPTSWYHSRECNLLIDDPTTAVAMYNELQRPQQSLAKCFFNK